MKKFNKKSLVLLVCAALLLTFTVSGTVAYLVDASGPVENQFKPATVDITTEDKIENGAKKDVFIKNGSTIPVYIRVAVIANWYNEAGEIVAPWNDHSGIQAVLAPGWIYKEGYYYYTQAVQSDQASIPFFKLKDGSEDTTVSYTPGDPPVEGAHLEMTIIAQAIQTEPAEALTAAHWAWSPATTE